VSSRTVFRTSIAVFFAPSIGLYGFVWICRSAIAVRKTARTFQAMADPLCFERFVFMHWLFGVPEEKGVTLYSLWLAIKPLKDQHWHSCHDSVAADFRSAVATATPRHPNSAACPGRGCCCYWKTDARWRAREAVIITSRTASQVARMSSSFKVGWTRNIKLVSPNSRATGRRSCGRHSGGNAFSR
jgi:hypothetical protein